MFAKLLLYWSVLAIGIVLGARLFSRKKTVHPEMDEESEGSGENAKTKTFFPILDKLMSIALAILIFVLGVGIGADDAVFSSILQIGLSAFTIALFGMAGSVFFTFLARKMIKLNKEGLPVKKEAEIHD